MISLQLIQLTLLCVLSVAASAPSGWEHTVYIDTTNGEDRASCLTANGTACATLTFVFAHITHSTHIVLLNGRHTLSTTILLLGVTDIALSGPDGGTATVECTTAGTDGASLKFVNVTHLSLSDIKVTNCGSLQQSTALDVNGITSQFRAAVYILNSTNVSIARVEVCHSSGIGLVLYDVSGGVIIDSSAFLGNSVPEGEKKKLNGGGGVHIEHTYCTPGTNKSETNYCDLSNNPYSNHSSYTISNCTFSDNHGSSLENRLNIIFYQEKSHPNRLGSGGGLAITLSGVSSNNNFDIHNCSFRGNSAVFGGGVSVHLHDEASNNKLRFRDCLFEKNSAEYGGGGFSVGYFFYDTEGGLAGNAAIFENVNISSNSAQQFGGGGEIVASRTRLIDSVTNSFNFSNCTWMLNSAPLAAALILAPEPWNSLTDGHLPTPVFSDCKFVQNSLVLSTDGYAESSTGIFFSSTFSVNFSSSMLFLENNGSAISINAASINVLNNTVANFTQNRGNKGGAISLLEFAHLRVFPKSELIFDRNRAYEVGGAIYVEATDELDFYILRSCFIHYYNVLVNVKDWDAKVNFTNNRAGPSSSSLGSEPHTTTRDYHSTADHRGQSIFTVSILPCWRAADTSGDKPLTLSNIFPHVNRSDPFVFSPSTESGTTHIATAPSSLKVDPTILDSEGRLRLIPGEVRTIPIIAQDDFNNSVSSVYRVYVTEMTSPDSVQEDPSYEYITNNTIRVNGINGSNFTLNIHTVGRRRVHTSVNATLANCPPGLSLQSPPNCNSTSSCKKSRCVCSATTGDKQYVGITKCSTEGSYGLLNKGFWAGCEENATANVLTSECPLGYCRSELSDNASTKPFYALPKTCEEVDAFLCGPRNRTGMLCGECAPNLTVLYHSQRFTCSPCDTKYTGWLVYIASELLPVTLVFLAVVTLNIHLTSGMWNIAILYAQTIDLMEMNSLELYPIPKGIATLTSIHRFIYGSFNFEFFKYEDHLAFCLKDRATVLDILAFKYLTTGYACLLLVFLILCFRLQCWYKCLNIWRRCQAAIGNGVRGTRHRSWVIHGVSAFLVLSYAHCTKVSLQILTWANLRGEGRAIAERVVFLSGTVRYFSREHLIPYAIFALVVLVLTAVPLVVFLLVPLTTMIVSAVCGPSERLERLTSKLNFHSRLKPLIDSFEGCYKDKYRFFAGILFLYRFATAAIFGLTTNAVQLYITLELVLIVMLTVHAIIQPNLVPFYNTIDSLLLANLALVNGLTLFNYYWSTYSSTDDRRDVNIALGFQVFFVYLPLLYMLSMAVLLILTSLSKRVRRCPFLLRVNTHIPMYDLVGEESPLLSSHHSPDDLNDWPERMLEEDRQIHLQHSARQQLATTH